MSTVVSTDEVFHLVHPILKAPSWMQVFTVGVSSYSVAPRRRDSESVQTPYKYGLSCRPEEGGSRREKMKPTLSPEVWALRPWRAVTARWRDQ